MTTVSALENIYRKGFFGDYEGKNESEIIKVSEIKNLLIVQIVQYKNSTLSINDIIIDDLNLSNEIAKVTNNKQTRILWNGPRNWLLVSTNKNLLKNMNQLFKETDFAITDLSHSRAIIELSGKNSKEILKKGCPYNFNDLKIDQCVNSIFNGITITIDMCDHNPNKIRLFALRSFGESFFHSITDSCLEFGFEVK